MKTRAAANRTLSGQFGQDIRIPGNSGQMFTANRIIASIVIFCCMQGSVAADLLPYEAVYKTTLNGLNVKINRTMQVQDSRISLGTRARKFLFGLREMAVLVHNGDGVLMPESYLHKRRGLSHIHDKSLVFDWTDETVHDLLKPKRAPLHVMNPTYDKLSYQLQMRLDLLRDPALTRVKYCVTNGVRNRVYTLDRIGDEIIDTPLGKLRTTKWERTGDDDDRQVLVWIAPDWDFLLVRIDQTKKPGGKIEQLLLQSATVAGRPVTGLQFLTNNSTPVESP